MKPFKKHNASEPVNGPDQTKRQFGRPMLFPIFFCLVSGLLLILLKDLTLMITGYVFAAAMIVYGVLLIFEYTRSTPMVRIIETKLAFGLILLVTGSMLAFSPVSLKELLPYVWGLSLLFGGFLKVQYAFDRKSLGAEKWWILLILAAFSIIIGILSLLNPSFLGDKKELVIGILLTVEAVLDIIVFLILKRTIRKKIAAETPPVSVPDPASVSTPIPDPAQTSASEQVSAPDPEAPEELAEHEPATPVPQNVIMSDTGDSPTPGSET